METEWREVDGLFTGVFTVIYCDLLVVFVGGPMAWRLYLGEQVLSGQTDRRAVVCSILYSVLCGKWTRHCPRPAPSCIALLYVSI